MRTRSIRTKITVILLLIFCLLGLLTVFMTVYSSQLYQQEVQQKLNHNIAEHIVKQTHLSADQVKDKAFLKDLFHQLMVFNPRIEIYLLDEKGKILAYSAPIGSVKLNTVDLQPVEKFIQGKARFPLKGNDPRNEDRNKIFSVAPIMAGDQLTAYLYIILAGEQLDDVMQLVQGSYILKLSLVVLVAGLLFSLLTGFSFFNWLSTRLRSLSQAVELYQSGVPTDQGFQLSYKKEGDEIDLLSGSFEKMANTIQEQLHQLQSTDAQRRELVANVSHDLRTPLATLQAYLETLSIKSEGLSVQQRQEYLQTALKHCGHLSELVEQLFELAKFDAREIAVESEAFNLSELAQDILQKFQLTASRQEIVLSISSQKTLPFVYADISLIERALDNLVENALRHTPKGGSISIALIPDNSVVTVEIKDTGYGIADSDLPHIFDRFYQQEKSRSKQDHSGLGLAIVKRIVELHDSQISVTSEVQKGSSFIFQLPRVA